jgi:ketosteroid isomerase-like protein
MSKENVDLVRGLAEAFRRRDHERVFELYHPEIEWDASAAADTIPDLADVYHGHEGVRAFWRCWLSAWKDIQYEVKEVLDAGDEAVMLIHRQHQWGRHSGLDVRVPPYGYVFTIRDGRVVRVRLFMSHEEALEAAGLSE